MGAGGGPQWWKRGDAVFCGQRLFSVPHDEDAHWPAGATRDFYIRRFFRIAPLFYAMLLFTGVRDALYFGARHDVWEWIKSILFIFNFFPGSEAGIVWASWTIGVEMVLYAIFPLLFARFRSFSGLIALTFAALLGAGIFRELVGSLPVPDAVRPQFETISFFRHLPVFILGMLCWLIYNRFIANLEHGRSIGAALILGSLWAYSALLNGSLNVGFSDPYYWQPIIYSALLLGLAISPTRVVVNKFSLLAGKLSYSIYLLHPPTILFLIPVYRRIYGLGLPTSASFLLSFGVTLGLVLPASLITYHWIEAPGMKLGKQLLARKQIAPIATVTDARPI